MKFLGYERPDGTVGIRNYVSILSGTACMNEAVVKICTDMSNVVPPPHNQACSLLREDLERKKRTLIGIGQNPNVAAVLVVGLGCENPSAQELAQGIAQSQKPVTFITVNEIGNFTRAIERTRELVQDFCCHASAIQRKEVEVQYLTLALKCAGSDPISAITSNLIVGNLCDSVIEEGGTVILSETTEMIGAEHIFKKEQQTKRLKKEFLKLLTGASEE